MTFKIETQNSPNSCQTPMTWQFIQNKVLLLSRFSVLGLFRTYLEELLNSKLTGFCGLFHSNEVSLKLYTVEIVT